MNITVDRIGPLIICGGLFCGMLVASNAAGAKLISIGPFAASATVFSYSLSFLLTDIISEFYGKKTAHTTVTAGFFAVLVGAIFFQIAIVAPPAPFFEDQIAYETVFSVSFRIFLGGMVAYIISQNLDVIIYHALRVKFHNRHLWLRNLLSTLVGQLVDTFLFITIAFAGVVDSIGTLIAGQYLIKVVISVLHTPLMYMSRYLFRRFVLKDY